MKRKKYFVTVLISVFFLSVLVTTVNAATTTWSGKVNFWESTVATSTKDNTSTKTTASFTGNPYSSNIYIYLTQKTSGGAIISIKTKFSFKDSKTLNTSAVNGQSINLRAAREYVLDTQVQLSGKWNP